MLVALSHCRPTDGFADMRGTTPWLLWGSSTHLENYVGDRHSYKFASVLPFYVQIQFISINCTNIAFTGTIYSAPNALNVVSRGREKGDNKERK